MIHPLEDGEECEDDTLQIDFIFAHTPSYPEEAPSIRLKSACGLSDADIAQAKALVDKEIEANLGMAMIFTLTTAVKEWLQDKSSVEESIDPVEARKKADVSAPPVGGWVGGVFRAPSGALVHQSIHFTPKEVYWA